MGLKEEIASKSKEIVVDSYSMSIGEIMHLYIDGELDVHPEFQRIYRWDNEQKTRLIESILLGIPIPPIFVSQRTNGNWDVIDGQQRLSTILQFLQVLTKEDGELYDPLVLQPTKFLPSLGGIRWDSNMFSNDLKITFKREKLNFTIIKETGENDSAKYEMFQRLNTSGTHLTPQELRNCLLIMINKHLYNIINELCDDQNFAVCTPLTEKQADEQYNLEMVVRYLLYTSFSNEFLNSVDKSRNMDTFLTEELEKLATKEDLGVIEDYTQKFPRIFALLNKTHGENVFKKYKDEKFRGAVSISSFEAIIPGLYLHLEYWEANENRLSSKIIEIYNQPEYEQALRPGTRTLDRMCRLINFSRVWFSDEN